MEHGQVEVSELFERLDSTKMEAVSEAKAVLHENLNSTRESWIVNGLVDYYLCTRSAHCLDVICGVREPHDKHLFEKVTECLRQPQLRHAALEILGHVVRRQPSWLHKITQYPAMKELLKILREDGTILNVMSAMLILATLLPVIPAKMGPFLHEIFEIFSRISSFVTTQRAELCSDDDTCAAVGLLNYALYLLYQRLYGMYPCNFLSYLRHYYSQSARMPVFTQTVKPFLDRSKLHPLLVTASKDAETGNNRWMRMEAHDIVNECMKVSLDSPDCYRVSGVAAVWNGGTDYASDDSLSNSFVANSSSAHKWEHLPASVEAPKAGMGGSFDPLSSSMGWSPSFSLINTPPLGSGVAGTGTDFIFSGTSRGSLSVPQTPQPEGYNGVCLMSAPVTPRALDSPPPEPAIEATPENTPISTPNQELERAGSERIKPRPAAIARLGFRKPDSSSSESTAVSSSLSSAIGSSSHEVRATSFYNERLAKVALERGIVPVPMPAQAPVANASEELPVVATSSAPLSLSSFRVTSPVKFADNASASRTPGTASLPRPVPLIAQAGSGGRPSPGVAAGQLHKRDLDRGRAMTSSSAPNQPQQQLQQQHHPAPVKRRQLSSAAASDLLAYSASDEDAEVSNITGSGGQQLLRSSSGSSSHGVSGKVRTTSGSNRRQPSLPPGQETRHGGETLSKSAGPGGAGGVADVSSSAAAAVSAGYQPLVHSSSATSVSSQNSRCDSVIHDSTEEGASATLMDMETTGAKALLTSNGSSVLENGGAGSLDAMSTSPRAGMSVRRSSNSMSAVPSSSAWMADLVQRVERCRYHSQCEPTRTPVTAAGLQRGGGGVSARSHLGHSRTRAHAEDFRDNDEDDDDGGGGDGDAVPGRRRCHGVAVSGRRRCRSNPGTRGEKRSVKVALASHPHALKGIPNHAAVGGGGTLKRRKQRRKKRSTTLSSVGSGDSAFVMDGDRKDLDEVANMINDGDIEDEEGSDLEGDISCVSTATMTTVATTMDGNKAYSRGGGIELEVCCPKRHSSGTQTVDINICDLAISQILTLGLLSCPQCGQCDGADRVEKRMSSLEHQATPHQLLNVYMTASIDTRREQHDSRSAAPLHHHHQQYPHQHQQQQLTSALPSAAAVMADQASRLQKHSQALELQMSLMRMLLVYERHCRDVYAERSRRLLSRAKETYFLREQNSALQDQLALAERANAQLRAEVASLRDAAAAHNAENGASLVRIEATFAQVTARAGQLELDLDALRQELNQAVEAKARAERDLAVTRRELWCSQQEVENLRKKADRCVELTAKTEELERELSMQSQIVENVKMQREDALTSPPAAAAVTRSRSLRHASGKSLGGGSEGGGAPAARSGSFLSRGAQHEIRNLKGQCEAESAALEAARARLAELESGRASQDLLVTEHKRILKSREEEYQGNVKALEEKYENLKCVNEALELHVLKLTSRAETLSRQLQTSLRRKTASNDSLENGGAGNGDVGATPGARSISIPGTAAATLAQWQQQQQQYAQAQQYPAVGTGTSPLSSSPGLGPGSTAVWGQRSQSWSSSNAGGLQHLPLLGSRTSPLPHILSSPGAIVAGLPGMGVSSGDHPLSTLACSPGGGLPSISENRHENQFRPSLSPGPGSLFDLEQSLAASSPPTCSPAAF